jgi:tetratricopeptide (TPR) repeat protein
MTKAQILDALGRKDEATSARNKALGIANAQQLYGYGRQLQREKRADEAFALFLSTAKKYPDFWLSHAGLARVYSSKGDFDNATKQMEMALAGAPDAAKTGVRGLIKRLQAKQDINQ